MTEKSRSSTETQLVGVAAKHSHPDAPGLVRKLLNWLGEKRVEYCVDEETAKKLQLGGLAQEKIVPREKLSSHCNVIVVLGGDGTLISVCRHPAETPPKIIGVNLGTLGFLTEVTSEELFQTVQATLNGTARLEPRSLLRCKVIRNKETVSDLCALNDVVITKQALARIFALELYVNKDFAALVRGDGIIVSTPVGSTAYSMSAGGSIVHPQVSALLVTPICPHSLTSRPLVLPGDSEIRLSIADQASEGEIYLTVDGQSGLALKSSDEVLVKTSKHYVQMCHSPSKSYYEVLATKLKWATR